jgi:hypothetical protein
MLPVVVIVPVETDTVQNRPAVALPGIAMLPALSVPVPTAIVLVIVPADGAFMVIAPETVSVFVPLMVMPLLAAGAFIVKLLHASVPSTVTITPVLIVTESADVGGPEPPQVAVLLQLPVTEAVYAAARAGVGMSTEDNRKAITSIRVNKTLKIFLFIF